MKYNPKQKDLVIVWEFKNTYGEQFIIFFGKKSGIPEVLCITWDEFDWEVVELTVIKWKTKYAIVASNKWYSNRFLFSQDEAKEVLKIIEDFNDDIFIKL